MLQTFIISDKMAETMKISVNICRSNFSLFKGAYQFALFYSIDELVNFEFDLV